MRKRTFFRTQSIRHFSRIDRLNNIVEYLNYRVITKIPVYVDLQQSANILYSFLKISQYPNQTKLNIVIDNTTEQL